MSVDAVVIELMWGVTINSKSTLPVLNNLAMISCYWMCWASFNYVCKHTHTRTYREREAKKNTNVGL